jgi:glycosyltransferase 2 family protein
MTKGNALNTLTGWRIWIPVLLGLSISIWILVSNLNEVRFVEVKASETGTHAWVDSNHNGQVDYRLAEEFVPDAQGSYRQQSLKDVVTHIDFSASSWLWLLGAVLMIGLRDFGYMWRVRLLTDRVLSWKQSFFVIMIWEFASALTPGVVGGTAVAMFILNKEGVSMGRSTSIVVITALMDNLFFVLLVPILLLLLPSGALFPEHSTGVEQTLPVLFWTGYVAMLTVCLLLFLSIFLFPSLLKRLLSTLTKLPLLNRWHERALITGEEIRVTSGEFSTRRPGFWIRVFLSTMLSWTGRYLVINMVLMAFLPLGGLQHLLIFAKQFILWVLMLVSPTPGASGVAEWAFSELLGNLAPSALVIVSLAIVWRLISYFPYLFIGSVLLPRWLKKSRN